MKPAVLAAATLLLALHAADASAADDRARRHAPEGSEATTLSKPAQVLSKTANPSHVAVEGGVDRPLWIDTSRVVEFPREGETGSPAIRAAEPGEVDRSGETGRTGKTAGAAAAPAPDNSPRVSPVFVDAGGRPRALPGGVIVSLKQGLPDEQARQALQDAGLTPVRRIGERMWLVESPVGIASLELANRLAGSGQFEFVQPNWWQPRTTK